MFAIPAPYLYGGIFLAGLVAGGYGAHTWHKAQLVDAIEAGRKTERGLQRGAHQADVRHVERVLEQLERARKNAVNFERTLNEKNRELHACRVDAELLGVLDDAGALPGAAGDSAESGPGSARTPAASADSDCAVELGRCRGNYAEVCVPNAVQLRDLRDFTRGLIRDYNRATGRE